MAIDPSGTGTTGVCLKSIDDKKYHCWTITGKKAFNHIQLLDELLLEFEEVIDTICFENIMPIGAKASIDMIELAKVIGWIENLIRRGFLVYQVQSSQVKKIEKEVLINNNVWFGWQKGNSQKSPIFKGELKTIHELDSFIVLFLYENGRSKRFEG